MKPEVIIIVSEDGDSPERLELHVRDRAQAEEIVREVFPPRTLSGTRPNGDYPMWTWFIPNPLPPPRSLKPSTKSTAMKTILESLRVLLVLTVLTGLAYPLVVTGIARVAFHEQATGSVGPLGSKLLAQKTEIPKYFWPRPSAADYG